MSQAYIPIVPNIHLYCSKHVALLFKTLAFTLPTICVCYLKHLYPLYQTSVITVPNIYLYCTKHLPPLYQTYACIVPNIHCFLCVTPPLVCVTEYYYTVLSSQSSRFSPFLKGVFNIFKSHFCVCVCVCVAPATAAPPQTDGPGPEESLPPSQSVPR